MKTLAHASRKLFAAPDDPFYRPSGGKRVAILGCFSTVLWGLVTTGCTICSDCGDLDYPTYGGAWQRTRRDAGRVGSIFDPAGARTATLSPRDQSEITDESRSPAESILSAPPGRPRDLDADLLDDQPEPSPSDRFDRDSLRSLDLDEINIERGFPVPPDLD